jgi:hypothetical protein
MFSNDLRKVGTSIKLQLMTSDDISIKFLRAANRSVLIMTNPFFFYFRLHGMIFKMSTWFILYIDITESSIE